MTYHRAVIGRTIYNSSAHAHEALVTIETSAGADKFLARAYLPMNAPSTDIVDEFLRVARGRFKALQSSKIVDLSQLGLPA